jgi:hypothetical protein
VVDISEFSNLRQASVESRDVLARAADGVKKTVGGLHDCISVLIVGSYGRLEARTAVSDLEWLLVFDERHVAPEEAACFQANVAATLATVVGREKLSIGKTFGTICSLDALCTNVGGVADSNQTLTYRVLALTEGRPLYTTPSYELMLERLAHVYGATHTAGHRLLSLATDVARYWRTLRIDYKHKVDEEKKPWAIRSIKLRAVRRFAYLSSAMHFVAHGPREKGTEEISVGAVKAFMSRMPLPPTERLIEAWGRFGGDEAPLRTVLSRYDKISGALADPSVRQHLDKLDSNQRSDKTYSELRADVQALHSEMATLALATPDLHRMELIEMFLL